MLLLFNPHSILKGRLRRGHKLQQAPYIGLKRGRKQESIVKQENNGAFGTPWKWEPLSKIWGLRLLMEELWAW